MTQRLLIPAIGLKERPVQWLVRNYLPLGNVTIFEGDGGSGKTTMAIEVIAKISRGDKVFFDGSDDPPVKGGSVILAAEEAYDSILRPKLRLANADLREVYFLPTDVRIPDDLEQIEAEIAQLAKNSIRVVLIDPLSSFSTKSLAVESSARQILDRLGHLAEKFDVAVLVVRHLAKNESASITNRGLGSVGIGARARSAFMFVPDPLDDSVKLMLHTKHNWSAEQPTPRFEVRVASTRIGKRGEARQVDFALVDPLGFSPLTVADFARKARTDTGKLERAKRALESMPVGNEVAVEQLLTEAACGRRTLETAKGLLVAEGYRFAIHQIGNNKGGNERKSLWVLVAKPVPEVPDDPNEYAADEGFAGKEFGDNLEPSPGSVNRRSGYTRPRVKVFKPDVCPVTERCNP